MKDDFSIHLKSAIAPLLSHIFFFHPSDIANRTSAIAYLFFHPSDIANRTSAIAYLFFFLSI
jgi:hypothetical protein